MEIEPPSTVGRRGLRGFLGDLNPRNIAGPRLPLTVFCLTALLAGWDDTALQLALPEIQDDFGLSLTMLSVIGAVTLVVTNAAGLPLGYLTDRVAKRVRLVQFGQVAANLGDFLQALAPNAGVLLTGRVLGGVARLPHDVAQIPLLADYYPPSSRGRVIAMLRMAAGIGSLLAAPIAGYLLTVYGWRMATLVLAVMATAVACLTFLLREPRRGAADQAGAAPSGPRPEPEERRPPGIWEGVRAAWSVRTLRVLAVSSVVYGLTMGGLTMVSSLMAARDLALDPFQRSLVLEAQVICGLLVVPLAGALSDRLLVRRPALLAAIQAMGTLGIGCLVLTLGLVPSVQVFIVTSVLFSAIAGIQVPSFIILITQVLPARHRGVGLQLTAPFQLLGGALSPVLLALTDGLALRYTLLSLVPVLVVAGLLQLTCMRSVAGDVRAAREAA
ncbi:MFS transporter [Acrocarpospora macrocephala]|uniref:MFS transporter n=1 Tax=Acrocarpospora macrocephala TaxID=150177 RepID=A0A5M3X5D8_9ACTN|nr:MFS transporter [Acrocarpospora macrocephala]GES16935.1 MFS transporter [Acrocarpospora macrocephala]